MSLVSIGQSRQSRLIRNCAFVDSALCCQQLPCVHCYCTTTATVTGGRTPHAITCIPSGPGQADHNKAMSYSSKTSQRMTLSQHESWRTRAPWCRRRNLYPRYRGLPCRRAPSRSGRPVRRSAAPTTHVCVHRRDNAITRPPFTHVHRRDNVITRPPSPIRKHCAAGS